MIWFNFHAVFLWMVASLIHQEVPNQASTPEILGVYGGPGPFWEKGLTLDELSVNSLFVRSSSINSAMVARARREGSRVYAEFPTLNGKNYLEDHPEAWPIDQDGQRVSPASWFMGICPTDPGFRKDRLDQLDDLLARYELDGIWMDYFHWHAQFEEPEPILPETCFCDRCLAQFERTYSVVLPNGSISQKASWILNNYDSTWRNWRCNVLLNWAVDIRERVKLRNPRALVGLFHCPWTDEEFDSARRRILGLDLDLLSSVVDVFSPMVYHGRMKRRPDWVGENVQWLCKRLNIKQGTFPKVWPIVQAHEVSGAEFKQVMYAGLSGESSGVMMFTASAVSDDPGKTEIMQRIYQQASR